MMRTYFDQTKLLIWRLSLALFIALAAFAVISGIFFWDGLDPNYAGKSVFLRGVQMLLCLSACGGVWLCLRLWTRRLSEDTLSLLSTACFVLLFALQLIFLRHEPCQLRYDALKVFDEALSMLSDGGISNTVFDGYFARYTNNHGITVFAYLILKAADTLRILTPDHQNALFILQVVNVIFIDLAFLFGALLIRSFEGIRPAFLYLLFILCCPLSYTWLPFFYTNSISMVFCMGSIYLLYEIFIHGNRNPVFLLGCGFLTASGFLIRATQIIICIAMAVYVLITDSKKSRRLLLPIGVILLGACLTLGGWKLLQRRYTVSDEDARFPAIHWVAMGLNTRSGGAFDALDEAYTMHYPTAAEKKAADMQLLKERLHSLGFVGVLRLYFNKLRLTFSDGTGAYPTELSISERYDGWYQNVYGNQRFYLQYYCQLTYLLALCFCIYGAFILLQNKAHHASPAFSIYLSLLGAFLFHMIWEAGSIYSTGFICLVYAGFGCGMAIFVNSTRRKHTEETAGRKSSIARILKQEAATPDETFKKLLGSVILFLICVFWIRYDYAHYTEERRVALCVNQYLFLSDCYEPCDEDMKLVQTFETDSPFDEIYLQAVNDAGEANDSIYRISLLDGSGEVIDSCDLTSAQISSYNLTALPICSQPGITDYALSIEKVGGADCLTFLYYDTGNCDVYKQGRLTGLKNVKNPDLCFIVLKVL